MARTRSISTMLAEVTPYWEPALWILIVVVTVGIVGSALWAPSRTGRRRERRKLFRRSDAKARRDERAAAQMVATAPTRTQSTTASARDEADFYAEPATATVGSSANVAAEPAQTEASAVAAGPPLFDQEVHGAPAPPTVAPAAPAPPTAAPVPAPEPAAPAAADAPASPPPVPTEPPVPAAVDTPNPLVPPAPPAPTPQAPPAAEAIEPVVAEPVHAATNGAAHVAPSPSHTTVTFADVEAGFSRLGADIATLDGEIRFFDERSNVPPEMPTWPIEHQQALAERAAEALADPLDQLLERSLDVASDVRALDRLLGGRAHDEASAQAIVQQRIDIDGLRRQLNRVQRRFADLSADFAVLAGTYDQLAKVASIVDATDAVMGSWEPALAGAVSAASAHR